MKLHLSTKMGSKVIFLLLVFVLPVTTGCSIRRMAVNMVGDAMVKGNSVFESDEDLELVGEALPFGLKLMESLLAESPKHSGLLQTSCKGFVSYSYLYVHFEADVTEEQDLDRARAMKKRARKLYLRGLSYGLRGLEKNYPGFENQLFLEPAKAVNRVSIDKRKRDLPLLYWTSAALGLAISVSRDDATLLGRFPEVEALIDRGLELDEKWENGAFHSFKIQLAAAKVGGMDEELIRHHFDRGLELTKGQDAGLYVALAEAVSIPNQDKVECIYLLNRALAIDPDENPQTRLMNLNAQRKARWLLEHIDDLILE